jgi:predicted ATPase/class 3 adenylate cyclase
MLRRCEPFTPTPNVSAPSLLKTLLFTDIEGSSRLWEQQPERMTSALAWHDRVLREAVGRHRGQLVKSTGDGMLAVFDDPRDAVAAAVDIQTGLRDPGNAGLSIRVRCGIHAGTVEWRDGDYYGTAANRAARIMSAAHGGQALVSQTVADLIRDDAPSGVKLRDLGTIRLRDLASPERVYQIEHAGLAADFPPLRSLEGVPNNLPQQLTTFIGRERVLAEIKNAFATTRLLTLSGIGGLGKTRLSLQVAAELLADFADGVWFVELAPLRDARLVPQAVASALGLKEEPGGSAVDALAAFVADRRLLIVLDNCEHLVQACAELAKQLLRAGPRLKILASSREHFNLTGETVYTVPPLSVPEAVTGQSPDRLVQYESVRLFVERATAVQHAFRLTPANAAAVVEICQRLDGIPLALELAAARVRALSVEQIAQRVNDRFRLLTSGDRTADARQQTLRSMIDWSFDLLDERERMLFRRLSVFAGGWTLDAAEAVASDSTIGRAEILDLLAELVDKSLVISESDGARYRFLETVREYAEERLMKSGEEDIVRARHLAFYLALAEAAGPALAGPEPADWLAKLDADRENLLVAHARCAQVPQAAECAYRLVHAIRLYWFIRGLLNLAHRVGVEALSLPAPEPDSLPRCKALWAVGQICSYSGRYEEAQRYLYEALAIAQHHGDRRMVAAIQNYLALAALGQGDRALAYVHSKEALELAKASGSRRDIAVASNALAQLQRLDGRLDEAERLYDEVVALARELRDQEFGAIGTLGLAMVAIGRGDAGRARELLREALRTAQATGSKPAEQSALEVAAGLAANERDWARAARLYGAAEAHTALAGIRRDPADEAFLQPLLMGAQAALGAQSYGSEVQSGRAMPLEQAVREVQDWLSGSQAP